MKSARTLLAIVAGALGLVLTLPALLLMLPFWATSFVTAAVRRRLEPKTAPWPEIIRYEPEVGWRARPNVDVYAQDFGGDVYHLTTDGEGWRGRVRLDEAQVVAFGDSFAFGDSVDDEDFFGNLGGDPRIKAIGCSAYSMVQPLIWMRRLAPRLEGKLVVWLVYLGNDLSDSLHPHFNEYRAPYVRALDGTGAWEVTTRHVSPRPWPFRSRPEGMRAFVKVCSPTSYSERVFSACGFLIERGRKICEAAGARLILVTIPDLSRVARRALADALRKAGDLGGRFDDRLPDRRFGEICERLGVQFVPLRDHLTAADYRRNDFHWNERGHRRVADVIRGLYVAHSERADIEPPAAATPITPPSGRPRELV